MELIRRWSWVIGALGAALLVAFLSTWWVTQDLGPAGAALGVAAGVLLMTYAALDGERLSKGAESRSFRYGTGAASLVGLAGLACVLVYMLAERNDHTWDLTADQRFTLSEHTKSVVAGIDREVEIYGFFPNESPGQKAFQDLVERYEEHSGLLRVELVDPLRSPMVAEQFAITSEHGTVVLASGDDRQRLESDFSEDALTSAIIRLLSGVSHRVCWSVGHGEADPDDDYDGAGYGAAVIKLEGDNYEVTEQRVLTQGVDRGCEALVIAAPQVDWLPREREALAAYVAEGGRALVLLEPDSAPELAADLARYGVDVGDDVVLEGDTSRRVAEQDPSFIAFYGDGFGLHPVTRSLGAVVMASIARSVTPQEAPADGLIVQPLLKTSPDAWGESAFRDPNAPLSPDPGVDALGPVAVAVAVTVDDPEALEVEAPRAAPLAPDAGGDGPGVTPTLDETDAGALIPADFSPKPGGRLVVVGDSDFASNQLIALGNDQDLFLNAIAWLVDEEDQLGERPEDEGGGGLSLTIMQEALMWLVTVFLVPGSAVVAAGVVMLRRRML